MKAGYKSAEVWLVGAVIIFAVMVAKGWLKPEHVDTATDNIKDTAAAIPTLIASVKELLGELGPLLVAAGGAWAVVKRRSSLKAMEIKALSKQ